MSQSRKLPIGPVQTAAIRSIADAMTSSGISGRTLAERAEIGVTRCAAILKGERVLTVDEFEAMCNAVGLIAWRVMQNAENATAAEVVTFPASPGYGEGGDQTANDDAWRYAAQESEINYLDEQEQQAEFP